MLITCAQELHTAYALEDMTMAFLFHRDRTESNTCDVTWGRTEGGMTGNFLLSPPLRVLSFSVSHADKNYLCLCSVEDTGQ